MGKDCNKLLLKKHVLRLHLSERVLDLFGSPFEPNDYVHFAR